MVFSLSLPNYFSSKTTGWSKARELAGWCKMLEAQQGEENGFLGTQVLTRVLR